MRRAVAVPAAGVALAGSTLLAFFSGGYYSGAILAAGIVAWVLVLAAAVLSPRPVPRSRAGRAAIGGLVLLCLWTAVSFAWAPLDAPATDELVRVLLYVGALAAAAAWLHDRALLRAVEPALALGAFVVVGYGLIGRLLPGLIELEQSARAGNRLYQPLTYWNAAGALAAIGFVLCVRIAGDRSRSTVASALAAAACAPLGAGLYLSYSRGAIAAGAIGLGILLAAAPSRSQLRALGVCTAVAAVGGAAAGLLPDVARVSGSLADREREGLVMLAILVTLMVAAALVAAWMAGADRAGGLRVGRLGLAPRLPVVVAGLVGLTLAGLVYGGLREQGEDGPTFTGRETASRLTTLKSRRYDYWRIAGEAFAEHPLKGVGAGAFRVEWRRERPVREGAQNAHSLPLELACELGVVGLAAFLLFVAGACRAAGRALRREPGLLAGAVAAGAVWLTHASFDWTWQLPAVTLPALVILGALIAAGEGVSERRDSGAGAV